MINALNDCQSWALTGVITSEQADDFPVLLTFSRIDNYPDLEDGVRTQIKRAYELSVWSVRRLLQNPGYYTGGCAWWFGASSTATS